MKNLISIAFLFIFVLSCNSDETNDVLPDTDNATLVVGYFPTWKENPPSPQWDKITHLCLAFAFVQPDGSLDIEMALRHKNLIKPAHDNKVKVLLSVGGAYSWNFSAAILNPLLRNKLIDDIEKAIVDLNLDGVDIDFEEWDGGYDGASANDLKKRDALEETFKSLRQRLGNDKLIAAAVAACNDNNGWGYYNCYNNTMHQYLDFASLMIYDKTGPWPGSPVGPHSDWDFFEQAINHWLNNKKLPKEKLIAGVPFYGYSFKSSYSSEGAVDIAYSEILLKYPDDEPHLKDNVGLTYYDGMNTIKRKTEFVVNNHLKGIMIWELTLDTDDQSKSLLNMIHNVIKPRVVSTLF